MTTPPQPAPSPVRQASSSSEFRRDLAIALIYGACGTLWILFSTYLFPRAFNFTVEGMQRFELAKGYLFILVSSMLFFALLRAHSRHQRALRMKVVRSEGMAHLNGRVLEMLAAGGSLKSCMTALARGIEEQRESATCAIMMIGTAGDVTDIIAPSLATDVCCASGLNGDPPCGVSIAGRERVIVTDLAADPMCQPLASAAIERGLNSCCCNPILSGDGDVLGVLAVYYPERGGPSENDLMMGDYAVHTARIIIEHDRTRTRLANSERVYRDLVEQAPVGICISSSVSRHFQSVNPALVRMLGYSSAAELEALDLERDVYLDPDDRRRFFAQLREKGSCDTILRWKRKDGRILVVRCLGTVLHHEAHSVTARISCEDISEKREIEARSQQAQRLESIGRLAGGISHDFNNILMVTQSYAELLEPVVRHSEQGLRFLREITKASGRAAELTRQLLAFSRKQPFTPQAVDLNDRINGSLASWTRLLGRRVKITTTLAENLPPCLMDPAQLEQIFLNLLLNARDAMPDGGEIRIGTSRETSEKADRVCLEVSDSGKGIAPEVLPNIFDPFFTTKDPGKGTGLGLASVYGIIERAGGDVKVSSTVGKGTTFHLCLPISTQPVAAERVPFKTSVAGDLKGTVMLVEDEEAILDTLSTVTRSMGLKTLAAKSAEEALQLLEHEPRIDLLVTDVVMPGMNGLELAEILLRRLPEVKILIVSGYARGEEEVPFQGFEFLLKPIGLEQFRNAVRRILATAPK